MVDHIDEQSVVRAAKEWAIRSNKSQEEVVVSTYETMSALKAKLTHDQYNNALRNLYYQYNNA